MTCPGRRTKRLEDERARLSSRGQWTCVCLVLVDGSGEWRLLPVVQATG